MGRVHQDLLRIGAVLSCSGGRWAAQSPALVAHCLLLPWSVGRRSVVTSSCCSRGSSRRVVVGRGWLVTRTCCARRAPLSRTGTGDRAVHQLLLRIACSSGVGDRVGPGCVTRTCCSRGPPRRVVVCRGGRHQLLLRTCGSFRVVRVGAVGSPALVAHVVLLSGRSGGVGAGHQLLLRTACSSCGRWAGCPSSSPALVAHGFLLLGVVVDGGLVTRTCCAPRAPSGSCRVGRGCVTRTCCSWVLLLVGGWAVGGRWSPALVAHVALLPVVGSRAAVTRTCCASAGSFRGGGRLGRSWSPGLVAHVVLPLGGVGGVGVGHQLLLRTWRSFRVVWSGGGGHQDLLRTGCSSRVVFGLVGCCHQDLLLTGSSSSVGGRSGWWSPALVAHCVLLRGRWGGGVGGCHQLLLLTGSSWSAWVWTVGGSPALVAHGRSPAWSAWVWRGWSPGLVAHGSLLSVAMDGWGRWSPALVAHGHSSAGLRRRCSGMSRGRGAASASDVDGGRIRPCSPALVAHRELPPMWMRRNGMAISEPTCCACTNSSFRFRNVCRIDGSCRCGAVRRGPRGSSRDVFGGRRERVPGSAVVAQAPSGARGRRRGDLAVEAGERAGTAGTGGSSVPALVTHRAPPPALDRASTTLGDPQHVLMCRWAHWP